MTLQWDYARLADNLSANNALLARLREHRVDAKNHKIIRKPIEFDA